ncbi:MAG: hypothetical protein ACK5RL_19425 [Acidimicrobiales bacterium]
MIVASTACSEEQLGDRGGENGSPPDSIGDVDYVVVFRNADRFPNVARICIDGVAFASTSSSSATTGSGVSLIRVEEWDDECRAEGSSSGDEPLG